MQQLWDTICIYECRITTAQRIELHIEKSKLESNRYRSILMISRSIMEVIFETSPSFQLKELSLEDLMLLSFEYLQKRYSCTYKQISRNFIIGENG